MLITNISVANPTVITVTGHNAINGQVVAIDSTNSTPALSGDYVSTFIDANTFSVPVNVTVQGTSGNAYPVLFCDYEGGNNANNGTTFTLRVKDLTNGLTAARLFPGFKNRIMASPDATSLGQAATWTDGPLASTVAPVSSTNATPIVMTLGAGHGMVTGDTAIVAAHTTNTNANGVWNLSVSGNNVTLLNADGSNSVGNGVGGATGTVRKFTNAVVKLATAVTQNIACNGNQGSASSANWTASANVTCTVITTDFKEGGNCQKIDIAAGFTTGLAAYFPTGTLDLSTSQQLSFWFKQTAGTIGAAASIDLRLCSDAAGVTAVNTFNIPLIGALNQWSPITVDLATALGSAIQSIAFYVNTDNGAQTFLLDNIIVCKASSAADSLTNTSLIGKNAGTEGWYGIQSINGTRVVLDQYTNAIPAASPQRGYSGTTETVTTWKKETTKTAMAAAGAVVQQVMDVGSVSNLIAFSGGWNRTDMSTLTGETIFDGQNGFGTGIYLITNFLDVSLSTVRYNNGITANPTKLSKLTINNTNNNSSYGLFLASSTHNNIINSINSNNNGNSGNYIQAGNANNINITKSNNNSIYAISIDPLCSNNKIKILESKNNATAVIGDAAGLNYVINSTLNSAVKVTGQTTFANSFIWSTNENNDTDTHFGYTDGGLISSDTTVRHTDAGFSWKLSPTSTNRSASYPLPLKVATVKVEANIAKTVSVWFRRSDTGLTARLICKGGQLAGIPNDVVATMTEAADTWGGIAGAPLSVTVTATQRGVLEFYAECWGGTSWSAWIDDVSFS